MAEMTLADPRGIDWEGWDDPAKGSVKWKTLISGDRTPTQDLVCGLAEFGPSGMLASHHHAEAEIVHVLRGSGCGRVGDKTVDLSQGLTIFVPGTVPHMWQAGAEGLTLLYVIAASSFADVQYIFTSDESRCGGSGT